MILSKLNTSAIGRYKTFGKIWIGKPRETFNVQKIIFYKIWKEVLAMQILCQGNKWKCINSHITGYLYPNSKNLLAGNIYQFWCNLPKFQSWKTISKFWKTNKREERAHKIPRYTRTQGHILRNARENFPGIYNIIRRK